MANGMPISAVVGRRAIMAKMEDIFFSGTFGGEALSIAAAIATIDKLERENATERLWRHGAALTVASNALFEKRGFGGVLMFDGDGWWPRLSITNPPVDARLMTSLLRQEFVAAGLLLASSYNLCLPHDDEAVTVETLAALDQALARVREHLDSVEPAAKLKGSLVQPTFAVRKTA
jgi:glutamate-1-semialdehyde 2,1-aminomutase/spore coat polysaccharide biosynthesis protein SpsF